LGGRDSSQNRPVVNRSAVSEHRLPTPKGICAQFQISREGAHGG
jgi:hypothetical protein